MSYCDLERYATVLQYITITVFSIMRPLRISNPNSNRGVSLGQNKTQNVVARIKRVRANQEVFILSKICESCNADSCQALLNVIIAR